MTFIVAIKCRPSFSESFYWKQWAHPIVCSADCAALSGKPSWKE